MVLDASAVLAFLHGEPGADRAESLLSEGVVGAANWSEVAQKVTSRGADWSHARALLLSYGVRIFSTPRPATKSTPATKAVITMRKPKVIKV